MTSPSRLAPIEERWDTGLAIVAHPDDLEYGAASAIARWTSQGKRIVYCMVTRGEAGIATMPPEQAAPLRVREQLDSADVVGVELVEFLDHPDGMLVYGLPLRRDIARMVRRHRPEVVITGNFQDNWAPGSPNHADHIAVGRAVLDGIRDASNRWVFTELLDEGLEPWQASTLLVSGSPSAGHAVDVTDHLAVGIESLRKHAAYLAALGAQHPMADPAEFLEAVGRSVGSRLGTRFAAGFEVITP
jgi:LmbE family N-acetylglucosaminyl deacetylase